MTNRVPPVGARLYRDQTVLQTRRYDAVCSAVQQSVRNAVERGINPVQLVLLGPDSPSAAILAARQLLASLRSYMRGTT